MNRIGLARATWLGVVVCIVTGSAVPGCADSDSDGDAPALMIDNVPACRGELSCFAAQTQTHDVRGIPVIHKTVHGASAVAVRVLFDHGNRDGIQTWAESIALNLLYDTGASDLDSSEWNRTLDQLGASFRTTSSLDYATVSAVVPRPNWNRLWALLEHALEQPGDAEYLLEWERARNQHAYETELDDPQSAARIAAWSALFAGHDYDRTRQSLDDLQKIDSIRLADAWAALRTRSRMRIVVVGDVEWDDVRDKVEGAFGTLPAQHTDFAAAPKDAAPPNANQTAVLDYSDSPTWHITAYFLGPSASDPEYAALALGLRVLDHRLFAEVREAQGLAYEVESALLFYRQSVGRLSLSTNAPADALPVVQQAIGALLADPPDADELATVRILTQTALLAGNQTVDELASTLGDWPLTTGDQLDPDSYMRALEAVTPEQVQHALRRYLHSASVAAAGAGSTLDEAQLSALFPEAGPSQ